MADENAKIDDNRKKTLLGVTDDANAERKRLLVDATTGRLKVQATIAGFGTLDESTLTTSTGVSQNIFTFDAVEGEVYYVKTNIIGRKSDGTDRACFELRGIFYRNSGGDITQQGSTQSVATIRSNTDWDADFDVDTGNQKIEVTVQGASTTTVNWQANTQYYTL